MRTWENKVERVISLFAQQAYRDANFDKHGKKYKRPRPYRMPEEAEKLVQVLGMHDRKKAEIKAKEMMELLRIQGHKID